MDVSISVDFGQGYRVSLTPVDARKLYDQLKPLFENKPSATLTVGSPGVLWSASGMTTVSNIPSSNTYFTAKVSDETVDKMASELEAKVRAEMDKQGLGEESPCFCKCSLPMMHDHLVGQQCVCEKGVTPHVS